MYEHERHKMNTTYKILPFLIDHYKLWRKWLNAKDITKEDRKQIKKSLLKNNYYAILCFLLSIKNKLFHNASLGILRPR